MSRTFRFKSPSTGREAIVETSERSLSIGDEDGTLIAFDSHRVVEVDNAETLGRELLRFAERSRAATTAWREGVMFVPHPNDGPDDV